MTETPVLPRAKQSIPPPPRPWRRRAGIAATAAIAAFVIWAVNVEPLAQTSGIRGASSSSLEVISVEDDHSIDSLPVYVVPWEDGADVTMSFVLANETLLPIRVRDFSALLDGAKCGWHLEQIAYRMNPYTWESPPQPFSPFWLGPGKAVAIDLTGTLNCEDRTNYGGLNGFGPVIADVGILGIPRSQQLALDMHVGWTNDPTPWLEAPSTPSDP